MRGANLAGLFLKGLGSTEGRRKKGRGELVLLGGLGWGFLTGGFLLASEVPVELVDLQLESEVG